MEGRYLVPFGDVVGIAGDKDDLDRVFGLAQPLGQGNSVHFAHFHIQKKDVVLFVLRIVKQKVLSGGEGLRLDFCAAGRSPALHYDENQLDIFRRIVTNRNVIHETIPFFE